MVRSKGSEYFGGKFLMVLPYRGQVLKCANIVVISSEKCEHNDNTFFKGAKIGVISC